MAEAVFFCPSAFAVPREHTLGRLAELAGERLALHMRRTARLASVGGL